MVWDTSLRYLYEQSDKLVSSKPIHDHDLDSDPPVYLAYDSSINLSAVLQDMDIPISASYVNMVIESCRIIASGNRTKATYKSCNIDAPIDAPSNVIPKKVTNLLRDNLQYDSDILISTFDKLCMPDIISTLLQLPATNAITNNTAVIHHNLSTTKIVNNHNNNNPLSTKYSPVFNNCINTHRDQQYSHKSLQSAIDDGLVITNFECGSDTDNDTINKMVSLSELCIRNNTKITSCNAIAKSLRVLDIQGYCPSLYMIRIPASRQNTNRITNEGLQLCVNITKLNVHNNKEIYTCAPFARSLRTLIASGTDCRIQDYSISTCILIEELHVDNNSRITTCKPFASTLHTLSVSGRECGVGDKAISSCNKIRVLNATSNAKIKTCVPFANSIRVLHARKSCGISSPYLQKCKYITELDASDNWRITTCEPFARSLKTLIAFGCCKITDEGLKNCTQITDLRVNDNTPITTCAPFAKSLVRLSAIGECNITDDSIKMCMSIVELCACNNKNITTCAPFAKTLTVLNATGTCGITRKGIAQCTHIKSIKVKGNRAFN